MKKGIHPTYQQATVSCACGNTFTVGSTKETIQVEICSKCHPFWTGAQRYVDIEGRVDKFKKKMVEGDKARQDRVKKLKEKIERDKTRQEAPKSLKDLLKSMQ